MPWTLRELITAFKDLLRQENTSVKICLLVDGLDEFDGDHKEIVDLFKDIAISKHVKTCLSSRPWILFRDAFSNYPGLRLQDLTYKNIHYYVKDRFGSHHAFRKLMLREQESVSALITEVVKAADGVFLWIRLVLKSLLDGLHDRDNVAILQKRLRALPTELEALYTHLLDLIGPIYLPWASKAFQILRVSRELENNPFRPPEYLKKPEIGVKPLTLDVFHFALDDSSCVGVSQPLIPELLEIKCQETEIHLTARCAGLIEVSRRGNEKSVGRKSSIDYLHRTAREHFENGPIWSKILQHTATTDFSPYLNLLKGCVSVLPPSDPAQNSGSMELSSHNSMLPDESLINSALIYAYHCTKTGVAPEIQAIYLDEMDK